MVVRDAGAKAKAKATAAGATGAAGAAVPAAPPKRVLVLTGPASSEKIMKTQLSQLFKKAEGHVDFIIHEGEKECQGTGTSAEARDIMSTFFRGLPMYIYDETEFDERNWRCYSQVRSTLASIQEAMQRHAPLDGVLGFSMGANFAVMLAGQAFMGVGLPLKFVVPICPNAPGYVDQVRELFLRPVEVPAFIIRGAEETYAAGLTKTLAGKEIDTLDEPVVSEHVVRLFKDPEVFTHPNDHRALPAKPKERDQLVDKIIEFITQKSELPAAVFDPSQNEPLPLWRVPDNSGGRVVRWGESLESTERGDSLRPGSLVEEIQLKGNRLHYHLIAGIGPKCGWVTTQSTKGKLLVRAPPDAAGTTGEIWIVTIGTRGDLQPFVVLGMALRDAGYNVRLFGPPELVSFSASSGLRVTTICRGWSDRSQAGLQVGLPAAAPEREGDPGLEAGQGEAEQDKDWEQAQMALDDQAEGSPEGAVPGIKEPSMGWGRFFGLLHSLGVDTQNGGDVVNLAWLWNEMPKAIQNMMATVKTDGKPDLLIYNHLMVNMGLLMWRLYGIRALFANLGLEFHFAPRGEDSFNYNTLGAFDRLVVKHLTKEFDPRGVVPMESMSKDEFNALYNSKDRLLGTTKLIIYALPHEDQKVAKDWKFTGFWIYDENKQKDETAAAAFGGSQVLQRLQEFLLDGDTPVYMGWGSMPTTPGLVLILMKALINLRLRAIMVRGWGNLSLEALRQAAMDQEPERCEELCSYAEENVIFVDKAPHEWLLPRCSCSVHHGGAGTTAAAMRAGVPTIVVPLGYDQPVHGEWVQKLGMGVACSKMDVLEAPEFEAALRKATRDGELRAKAKNVAENLRKEPGVSAAVEKIRKIMRDDIRTLKAKERWEAENAARKPRRADSFWVQAREEAGKKHEEAQKKRAEAELKEEESEKDKRREAKKQKATEAEAEAEGMARRPSMPAAPALAPEVVPAPASSLSPSTVSPSRSADVTSSSSAASTRVAGTPDQETPRQGADGDGDVSSDVAGNAHHEAGGDETQVAEAGDAAAGAAAAEAETPVAPAAEAAPVAQEAKAVEQGQQLLAEVEAEEEAEAKAKADALAPPTLPGAEAYASASASLAPAGGVEEQEPPGQRPPGDSQPQPPQPYMSAGAAEAVEAMEAVGVVGEASASASASASALPRREEAAAEAPARPAEAQDDRETDSERVSELLVYIDRSLDISTTLSLRPGLTVRDVKDILANDDPTGETKPEDFSLRDVDTGLDLADSTLVSGRFPALEISVRAV